MNYIIAKGLLIPFLGTALGSALVFFMKRELNNTVQKMLSGFAAGVMVAASVWSLLIPSMEMASDMGKLAFIPAVVGFCLGMIFLLILDKTVPHMHLDETQEGPKSKLQKTTMMVLAVTLHNIPEGMAVGILYAGWASGSAQITEAGALSLALGIAIQNFPEGAIISMPLHSRGLSKGKSCWYGILSGIVEPVAGLLTILLASLVMPVLPYFLSFAAGAMIYVVVEELVPEMAEGEHSNWGTITFMLGFALMMVLAVTLHNIPEGMAVGILYAGWASGSA
ncbi:MAG: ZIP family metal transporter, partial [Treponema sp.]|nr:ZIP family metal transporter [Treponema sp.]